jgi:hypothetical protein
VSVVPRRACPGRRKAIPVSVLPSPVLGVRIAATPAWIAPSPHDREGLRHIGGAPRADAVPIGRRASRRPPAPVGDMAQPAALRLANDLEDRLEDSHSAARLNVPTALPAGMDRYSCSHVVFM